MTLKNELPGLFKSGEWDENTREAWCVGLVRERPLLSALLPPVLLRLLMAPATYASA